MLIDEEGYRILFVHIPKCGGQTIAETFLRSLGYSWYDRDQFLVRQRRIGEEGPGQLTHLALDQYLDLGWINPREFSEFTSFTIVRNPYARVISTYKFLRRWRYIPINTFVTFVIPRLMETDGGYFVKPQTAYTRSKHGVELNATLRIENMEQDFLNFKTRFVGKLPAIDALIERNRESRNRWSFSEVSSSEPTTNLSQKSIRMINEIYRDDFETFGYAML